MKFKVKQQNLNKAISKIDGIISSKEIRSIISNILLETSDNRLYLTTTDLEIAIKTSIPIELEKEGIITIPAKKLSQLIREFKTEDILVEVVSDNSVSISDASGADKTLINIMGSPGDEYPKIPHLDDKKYTQFSTQLLFEMMRKTNNSVAEEDARYVFNGMYLENKEKHVTAVGTDGRRLSKVEREFENELPFNEGIIIPNKAVREIYKLLDTTQNGKIALDVKENRVYFRFDDVELVSKLIEGQYPNYKQVIPEKLEYKVELNRDHLERSIRKVSIMAAEPSRPINFKFSKNVMEMSASTPDLGIGKDTIDIDYEGIDMTIAFNSNYIMDVIRILDSTNIIISFSSPGSQAVILDPGDKDFVAVIMPMKI